jgi:hypothetical protein
MSRRHTDLGSGPPRGPGHYSKDGRRWREDGHRRWFPVTDQEDELEIEAEDLGSTSLPARLLTTVFTQYGTPYYRFVGRARSADPRWPTYQVTGASFPATGLDDPSGKGAWAEEQRARLDELHQQLLREGWRLAGRGERWWSRRYTRPVVDLTGAGPAEAGGRARIDTGSVTHRDQSSGPAPLTR